MNECCRTAVVAELREMARAVRAKADNTSFEGETDFRPGMRYAADWLAEEADTVQVS